MSFPAYVIHLARRADRRAHLDAQPLPPHTLFPAVDPTALTAEERFELLLWYLRGNDASRDREALIAYVESVRLNSRDLYSTVRSREDLAASLYKIARFALDGIIGCARSHFLVWETIASGPVPGLVFEDDVCLSADTHSVLGPGSDAFPERWDVIYLNGPIRFDADLCTEPYSDTLRVVHPDPRRTYGAQSYLIHPACARELTEHIARHGVRAPLDWFLERVQAELGLAYFMLEPALGLLSTQAELDSDIQPPR